MVHHTDVFGIHLLNISVFSLSHVRSSSAHTVLQTHQTLATLV